MAGPRDKPIKRALSHEAGLDDDALDAIVGGVGSVDGWASPVLDYGLPVEATVETPESTPPRKKARDRAPSKS